MRELIISSEIDYLDKPNVLDKREVAYDRAFDIICNILGEDRPQLIDIESQNRAIYRLLRRLKDSAYENGSTEISKLYILWGTYFNDHPNYQWGIDVLIDIANNQEWFNPRDDLVEALQNLQIN